MPEETNGMKMAAGSHFDEARADYAVSFFEMLRLTDGHFHGKPFRLLPWQKKIVREVYGTIKEDGSRQYQYIWLEVPKKNGKSSGMGSGAALYHTFADGEQNGEVYSVAADRDQASIIFNSARDMRELSPALVKRSKITDSTKRIRDNVSKTVYRVLSSEAYSKHGYKPSAVLFDEIHAQPNRDLWDVMTFGSGSSRRQPIWWNMTTAGKDPDRVSIAWELHEYAQKVASGEIVDPTWYVAIFAYEGDDIFNEDNWYLANPSLGVTKSLDSMRADAARAKGSAEAEQLFRWLHLNQWVTSKLSSWLPLELFDETTLELEDEALEGKSFFIGQDASTTTDLSALCRIYPPQEGLDFYYVKWDAFLPKDTMQERIKGDHVPYDAWERRGWLTATEGNTIDHWVILDKVKEYQAKGKIVELVSDPAFAVMLTQAEMKAGVNVVTVQGNYQHLTDPMNTIEMLLKSGRMKHERNDLARWCFGNTSIAQNGSGLKKFVKETKGKNVIRTKRIDTTAALILGMCRVPFEDKTRSVYEDREMVVL